MKMLLLTVILSATSFAQAASQSIAAKGTLTASVCESSGSPFREDRCVTKPLSKNLGCSLSASVSGGEVSRIRANINGRQISGTANGPYQYTAGTASAEVTFGRLIRGTITTTRDSQGFAKRAARLEVYVNHDSSGQVYDRYRCNVR